MAYCIHQCEVGSMTRNDHDAHNALRTSASAPRVTYTEPKRKPARPVMPILMTAAAIVTLMMLAPYVLRYVQGVL